MSEPKIKTELTRLEKVGCPTCKVNADIAAKALKSNNRRILSVSFDLSQPNQFTMDITAPGMSESRLATYISEYVNFLHLGVLASATAEQMTAAMEWFEKHLKPHETAPAEPTDDSPEEQE